MAVENVEKYPTYENEVLHSVNDLWEVLVEKRLDKSTVLGLDEIVKFSWYFWQLF